MARVDSIHAAASSPMLVEVKRYLGTFLNVLTPRGIPHAVFNSDVANLLVITDITIETGVVLGRSQVYTFFLLLSF
jgi:hypothetical protein